MSSQLAFLHDTKAQSAILANSPGFCSSSPLHSFQLQHNTTALVARAPAATAAVMAAVHALSSPLAAVDDVISNAANGTSAKEASGLVAAALIEFQTAPIRYAVTTVLVLFLIWLYKQSIPEVDSKEPPLMLPRIPFIGHVIPLVKDQAVYFRKVYKKTRVNVATLPMMGGKTYAIWDPALIQSALRQKTLAFEPCAVDFAETMLGMSPETYKTIRAGDLIPDFFAVLHITFRGEHLMKMNTDALKYVSTRLDALDGKQGLQIPNFYFWVRQLMTMATCNALLGDHNPMIANPELVDHLWTWDTAAPNMLVTPFHSVTFPEAVKSREILQKALGEYYSAKYDTHASAAAVTAQRAGVLRKYGLPDSEIGRFEASLLQLATGNSIPTAFWTMAYIICNPDLLARVRTELEPLVERKADGTVSINTTKFDELAPLFVSCYREAIRVANHALCVRRVLEDTVISNGKGDSYVLKKGNDVQMSAGFTHRNPEIWGPNADEYQSDRFLNRQSKLSAQAEKNKRAAYTPFGGGRHLCPGRNFAFTEIQGCTAALIVGFDISCDGEGTPVKLPEIAPTTIMGAVGKPVKEGADMGLVIRRRAGWEDVKFTFEVAASTPL